MRIKNNTFAGCTNLKSIKVRFGYSTSSDNFEIDECFSLGNYNNAYYSFSKYTGNLTIYGSGNFDFSDNSQFEPFKHLIENLIVEEGIAGLGGVFIQNATSLKSVELCESLNTIRSLLFRGCSSLTTVYIPKNVKSIEDDAFMDCQSLESIEVSNENTNFISENGVLYSNSNDKKTLRNYPAGRKSSSFTVPSDVSIIDSYAFNYCNNLVSIEINQIESIHSSAFYYCSKLSSMTYFGSHATSNSQAFYSCDQLDHVNVLSNYLNKTFYGKNIKIIEIQSSNEIDESQPSSYEDIQSSKTDENIESSSEKVEDIESSSEKVDDTQISSFIENTNSIDTDESKSVVQEETSNKDDHSSSIEIIDSTINNEDSSSSSDFIIPVETAEPTPSEVIVEIDVPNDANDAELDKKLKEQFDKLSNNYDKDVNKVVFVSSSKIEFNSNLTDDQFIKMNRNDAQINYKGGNMNLVLDNSNKITISVDKENANISLKGEGEINFEQTDSNVDSISITKSSNINGSVKITVAEKVNQLIIDSIKFESKSSILIQKENNENPVHFSIKNIETTSNSVASISNVTVFDSLNLITLHLKMQLLNSIFFQGNFNNPPNKLVLNKLENSKDIHLLLNQEYTFVTGMFDDNQCEKWLESIDYGNTDFNTKNCLVNQLLSGENKKIVMKVTNSDKKGNKLSGGQIAGIVIGCIAGVAIIAVAIFFIIKRKKSMESDNEDSVNDDPTDL